MALTAKQQLFVKEYLIDLNATGAATRAGYSPKTAEVIGYENLRKPSIQQSIKEAQEKRSAKVDITAEMVLKRWWDIATANPNELIHTRRLACRHCHGIDHAYQWIDKDEYNKALEESLDSAERESKKQDRPIQAVIPSDIGGYGYNRIDDPNKECPKCLGEGSLDIHVEDTRKLEGGAKLLYAGVKTTANGIEVLMQDQAKALEHVARHLGMFKDKLEIGGMDGAPLQVVFSPAMQKKVPNE